MERPSFTFGLGACEYAVPDEDGVRRMFLCSVVLGDWCLERPGSSMPDPKPDNDRELFDSTVDNLENPEVYTSYHDAQSYPEYLITFRVPQVEQ